MSRRSRSTEDVVTLFPFLAVLLCTMGTLAMIFVLVAQKTSSDPEVADDSENTTKQVEFDPNAGLGEIAQYGKIIDARSLSDSLDRNRLGGSDKPTVSALVDLDDPDAAEELETEEPIDDAYERAREYVGGASIEDLQNEQDSLDWFVEELQGMRQRTEDSLESARERLANAEKALAKLREELEVTRRKYETLSSDKVAQDGEDAESLQAKIKELDERIEKLQEEALALREKNKNAKRSYAIVPYQGKKGTFRRPIYIECCKDGVFLQPEGIRFDDSDFLLARYPGNPFDSALRATAQHYLQTGGQKTASGDVVEPYPLLIVRPGGANYFYAAQAALASWGDLYGYEFVEDEQAIEYPTPDPALADLAARQADFARKRLAMQLVEARAVQNALERAGRREQSQGDANLGAGNSELQTRFGSNVRLGAVKSALPSFASNGAPNGYGGAVLAGSYSPTVPGGALGGGSTPSLNASGASNGGVPQGGTSTYAQNNARNNGSPQAPKNGVLTTNGVLPTGDALYADASSTNTTGTTNNATHAAPDGTTVSEPANLQTSAQNPRVFTKPASEAASASLAAAINDANNANGKTGADSSDATAQYVPNAAATATIETPGYLAKLQAAPNASATPGASGSNVDLRETLGNTTYGAGAQGNSDSGVLAKTGSNGSTSTQIVAVQKEQTEDSDMPREAIRLSQDRRNNSGNERGIFVVCKSNAIEFPKQPGVRASSVVKCDAKLSQEKRDEKLLDSVAFCIKSWGAAGKNAYWAPFLRVQVEKDGEERFRELSDFCKRQGLAIVRVESNETTKQVRDDLKG